MLAHPRRGSSGPPVRSLADDLRARSDAELAELLAARPDLSRPLPGDLTALAARAATPASLSRAVDALDAGALSVLHALVGAGDPVQEAQLRRDLGLTAAALRAAVTDLWRVALVWRGGDGWHVPRGVADILGPSQAPAVVLDQPPLPAREVGPEPVDSAAGAATADLLEMVDELADLWGPTPPRVLRAGGLAVADLKTVAEALDLPPAHAAFVVEIAYAAGLVDDDGALDPVWAPTAAYDDWQQSGPAGRWLSLAQAWLATTRAPSLVGRRHQEKGPAINALAEGAATALGRSVRHDVLSLLAAVPPGAAPDVAAIQARLAWLRPRRPAAVLAELAAAALAEAAWLGMTGYGALASAGRALLRGAAEEEIIAALTLPDPVDHVLLQADLTAVAPGRLEGRLAAFLRLAADVESRGGATVYRFTPGSLRRPLDAGWDAQQVLDALDGASSTGVPQPLAYLVGDVARRHGGLRVGAATAYVRSDDHVAIEDLVERPDLGAYRLRRLAPGVAVAQVAPNVLLSALRQAGLLPVAEGPEGAVVVPPTTHHRARTRRGAHSLPGAGRAGASRPAPQADPPLSAAVHRLRDGEERLRSAEVHRADLARSPLQELDPGRLAAHLRDAAAAERAVWIAVVDATGSPRRLRLRPDRIEGGRVYGAVDAGPGRSFSLHRISAVGPAE